MDGCRQDYPILSPNPSNLHPHCHLLKEMQAIRAPLNANALFGGKLSLEVVVWKRTLLTCFNTCHSLKSWTVGHKPSLTNVRVRWLKTVKTNHKCSNMCWALQLLVRPCFCKFPSVMTTLFVRFLRCFHVCQNIIGGYFPNFSVSWPALVLD